MTQSLQYDLMAKIRSDWRAGRNLGVSGRVWACLGVSGHVWASLAVSILKSNKMRLLS